MKRTERLRRVGALLETRERGARRAMAQANVELRRATVGLDSVLDQCERLGQPDDGERAATGSPLPIAATVAIVQAGLREAGERADAIVTATEVAEEHRRIWQDANRRQEAVDRLVDRWREREQVETDMRSNNDLDDVVTARGHRTTKVNSDEGVRR
ncbi:MAG: flagellar FliJ family protein [Acidimicrobiales bacterium]